MLACKIQSNLIEYRVFIRLLGLAAILHVVEFSKLFAVLGNLSRIVKLFLHQFHCKRIAVKPMIPISVWQLTYQSIPKIGEPSHTAVCRRCRRLDCITVHRGGRNGEMFIWHGWA